MDSSFRKQLESRQPLIGTLVTLGAPAVAERLADAGFDWLFLDAEHAPLDGAALQSLLQAAGGRCACAVRVPAIDEVWFKQALDIGAHGVIAPMVKSVDDARRVVAWCRYPPEGTRSVGVARAQGYGRRVGEYLRSANDDVAVILQIEHRDAVAAAGDIAAVPGVDALFLGPYDLSASLGMAGEIDNVRVVEAIDDVLNACRARQRAAGIFAMDAGGAAAWMDKGFTLIAVGIDTVFLGDAADAALKALRR